MLDGALAALYTAGVVSGGDRGPSISRLLVDLANNPELLDRFKAEPEAVMSEYGLNAGQKAILESGNLALIRGAIDYEYRAGLAPPGLLPGFGEEDDPSDPGVTMVVTWRRPPPTW